MTPLVKYGREVITGQADAGDGEENTCMRCSRKEGLKRCSCGERCCEEHLPWHLRRNKDHREAKSHYEKLWAWASGKFHGITDEASRVKHFVADEPSKWFGLVVDRSHSEWVTTIVETNRFSELMENSAHAYPENPPRQFPSLVSFVGETGAGKSTLIRALIQCARSSDHDSYSSSVEAPIPGCSSGATSLIPTSGEVNLYADPSTFGTQSPHLYADCEGLQGGEPACAQHQKNWHQAGIRTYLIDTKDEKGNPIDRITATRTLYPKFLYIFSDVVCFVTRNPKTYGDIATTLLRWSEQGARKSINQYALPAAIIILNAATVEDETWVADNPNVATEDFFTTLKNEVTSNNELRAMADNSDSYSIETLFYRHFSSVHVHFVPLEGWGKLGKLDIIDLQIRRLRDRILDDSKEVRRRRELGWMRFDSRQLSILFPYAFEHLAKRGNTPFDFNNCRRRTASTESIGSHIAEFLELSWRNTMYKNVEFAANVVGSSLVRRAVKKEGMGLVLIPSIILEDNWVQNALEEYSLGCIQCAFVHSDSGKKCVNTKRGHAKGHQSADGDLLAQGEFVSSTEGRNDFRPRFLEQVRNKISNVLQDIGNYSKDEERKQHLILTHRQVLCSDGDQLLWSQARYLWHGLSSTIPPKTCFACLMCRPEYILPCGHILCETCVRDFDESNEMERYPGVAIHKACIFCGSCNDKTWPWKVRLKSDLAGVCILSLDGGGVRGIVELEVLKRLEKEIGIGVSISETFDLIVGTSAGGLIALGAGIYNWDIDKCILDYESFCRNVFKETLLAKTPLVGYIVRLLYGAIYDTKTLESELKSAFQPQRLLGIGRPSEVRPINAPRVAVTTTVGNECKLFANYQGREECAKDYCDPATEVWEAARCTSAAPMYFTPYNHPLVGDNCRDGGLKMNNPISCAIKESKRIWGNDVPIDLAISIGTGYSYKSPSTPSAGSIVPDWLKLLFDNLMENLGGQKAWKDFFDDADEMLKTRVRRLNIMFKSQQEPPLDEHGEMGNMRKEASTFEFKISDPYRKYFEKVNYNDGISLPVFVKPPPKDILTEVALRLRANFFFLELRNMSQTVSGSDTVITVEAWICCKLETNTKALRFLLTQTLSFSINGKETPVPPPCKKPFMLNVTFRQLSSKEDELIYIEAKFQDNFSVAISGFPCSLKNLFKDRQPSWIRSRNEANG